MLEVFFSTIIDNYFIRYYIIFQAVYQGIHIILTKRRAESARRYAREDEDPISINSY